MSEKNLWGDLSDIEKIRTPKTILQEQAAILNEATQNVVRAEVTSTGSGADLTHKLDLITAALGNYQYGVAIVKHDVNIYPCRLYSQSTGTWQDCGNEAAFVKRLGEVLASPMIRGILASLISQST